jgi:hypothetical protein
MLTPNKEALTLWVEALESGKYRQTRGKYATPKAKRLCALGVRNYVYLMRRTNLDPSLDQIPSLWDLNGKLGWVSIEADQWYGINAFTSFIETETDRATVAEANDHLNMSFAEIAQHIRKKFL